MANGLQGRGRIRTISILPTGPGGRKNFSRLILKQTNGHFDHSASVVLRGCFGQETYRTATRDWAVPWSMAYRPLGISGDFGRRNRSEAARVIVPCRSRPRPLTVRRAGGCTRFGRTGAFVGASWLANRPTPDDPSDGRGGRSMHTIAPMGRSRRFCAETKREPQGSRLVQQKRRFSLRRGRAGIPAGPPWSARRCRRSRRS